MTRLEYERLRAYYFRLVGDLGFPLFVEPTVITLTAEEAKELANVVHSLLENAVNETTGVPFHCADDEEDERATAYLLNVLGIAELPKDEKEQS